MTTPHTVSLHPSPLDPSPTGGLRPPEPPRSAELRQRAPLRAAPPWSKARGHAGRLSDDVTSFCLLLRWRSPFVSGALLSGGIVALAAGIALLPHSLVGLFFVIGAFGFVPFLTSFTFFRNARRAVAWLGKKLVQAGIIIGFLSFTIPPVVAQVLVWRIVDGPIESVMAGNGSYRDRSILRRWLFTTSIKPVVKSYMKAPYQSEICVKIASDFLYITGRDIKGDQHIVADGF